MAAFTQRAYGHVVGRAMLITVSFSCQRRYAVRYAPLLVEVYKRERFGWWPIAHRRLDYVSEAALHVPRGVQVRIVLVDRDGWTPIATSRPVVLRRR